MLVREVLQKYHKRIPFPWTPAKVKKAGLDLKTLMIQMGADLKLCSDVGEELAKEVIESINQI